MFKVFPQADTGFVVLADRDEGTSLVKASQARGGEATDSVRISNTIVKNVMESGEAILGADALEDSRFNASDSLEGLAIRSMMCVPLIGQEGRALGVIQLDTKSLRHQFTQTDLDVLVSVGAQASLAIENARLHEDLIQRSDIERELRFATQVQLGFLPVHRPSPAGYEFFDYYEPAHRVGGDYFDYVAMPDGRIAIGLADVAGKGIPAALLMARLYSAVRLHLFTQPTSGKVLSALNDEIYSQGIGHRFVTFVLLMLNPETHELTIANAGHLPPIVRSPQGKASSIGRTESGMPLGIRCASTIRRAEAPDRAGNDSHRLHGRDYGGHEFGKRPLWASPPRAIDRRQCGVRRTARQDDRDRSRPFLRPPSATGRHVPCLPTTLARCGCLPGGRGDRLVVTRGNGFRSLWFRERPADPSRVVGKCRVLAGYGSLDSSR